jgi:hypothetical protein
VSEPQKSPHWDERQHVTSFVEEGFPFDEGFPRCGPGDGMVFDLITRDGQRHLAQVDFSTQYRAEGKKWYDVADGCAIFRCVVLAWRERQNI